MGSPQERLNRIWRHDAGRSILLLLMILAPLVLTLGIREKLDRFRTREFSIQTNRERCIQIANEFLRAHGGSTPDKGWILEFDEDIEYLNYVHRSLGEGKMIPSFRELPSAPAVIRLKEAGGGNDATEISVGPSGVVTGYRLPYLLARDSNNPGSRESTVSRASEMLPQALVMEGDYKLSDARVYEQTDSRGRRLYRVEWTASHVLLPELSFIIRFGVTGSTLFSQRISADVDDDYMAKANTVARLYGGLMSIAPLYIIALIVYMLVRYIQRTLEKEVSHGRALVVTFYILAMTSVVFLTGDQSIVFNIEMGDAAPVGALILVFFFFALAALLAGASYSACEGDVREHFPGTLTSFDALLTGRVLSKNVARAFIVSFVSASWLFFVQVIANLAIEGGMEEPGALIFVYRMAHAQFPAAIMFFLLPMGIGLVLLFGLLIPVSIVGRVKKLRSAAWGWVLLIVLVNLFLLHQGFVSLGGALVLLGAEAVTLLSLFLYFDLLTAFLCRVLVAYLFLLTDAQMLTMMPDSAVWPMHAVVAASLLLSIVLLRYGRHYSDEEVRPSYANALAERQSLSEQLSIAAVAQAQLTLSELPQVEGFSLAADCRPARVVSGDYYDCFRLGPRSLGVLMISGAGRGLLDAMVIAFTKGFLLEHAHADRTAPELLSDLLENLTSLLNPGDDFPELCFMLLDGDKRSASYSRTEGFPGVLAIRRTQEGHVFVRQGAKSEMGVTRRLRERSMSLRHGTISLDEQTSLLLFTRGLERSLERTGVENVREWLRTEWIHFVSGDAGSTLRKLSSAALGGTSSWQTSSTGDDRTLMVVQTVSAFSDEVDKAA